MSCDVSEVAERLENEPCCDYNYELCSDYNYELCSFSNNFVTSPTSQLILQPFRRFTYTTAQSPIFLLLHLRHSSFCNPSFASPTSQVLRLIHLASLIHEGDTHKYRQVLRMVILTNFKFWIVKKGHEIIHNTHTLYFSIY